MQASEQNINPAPENQGLLPCPAGTVIAFQGEPGAFSHVAAIKLFGPQIRLHPSRSFDSLFEAVARGEAQRGVVPIENSLAGSVHENYDRLREHELPIIAETQIPIRMCLITTPGRSFDSLERVASHPVALQQCRKFFAANPGMEAVVAYDTAGSVRDLMRDDCSYDAAIGPCFSAELYGAEVLQEGIEDNTENFTRFLVIANQDVSVGVASKTSLVITLPNTPGSLHKALGVFAKRGVDLSKLESRPVPGVPWKYRFYMDVRGDPEGAVGSSLAELSRMAREYRVLGSYPEGV